MRIDRLLLLSNLVNTVRLRDLLVLRTEVNLIAECMMNTQFTLSYLLRLLFLLDKRVISWLEMLRLLPIKRSCIGLSFLRPGSTGVEGKVLITRIFNYLFFLSQRRIKPESTVATLSSNSIRNRLKSHSLLEYAHNLS